MPPTAAVALLSASADLTPPVAAQGWRTSLVGGLVAFHILVAYLCLGIPFMNVIYRLLFPKTPIIMGGTGARARWFVLSIVVIGASFLVATAVPSFGAIQSLLGAFAGAPIVFGWPPLFYLLACHQKNIDVAGFDKVSGGSGKDGGWGVSDVTR